MGNITKETKEILKNCWDMNILLKTNNIMMI